MMRCLMILVLGTQSLCGLSSGQTPVMTFFPPGPMTADFGRELCPAGDVNGDGIPDFMYFRYLNTPHTEISVRSGFNGYLIHSIRPSPFALRDFGLGQVGDVDGDGFDDIGVTETSNIGGVAVRRVHVYSGLTGTALSLFSTNYAIMDWGLKTTVEGIGDINGDNKGDFIVGLVGGIPPASSSAPNACLVPTTGVALVVSGADGSVMRTHMGNGDSFPNPIRRLSDFDNDGISEYGLGGLGHRAGSGGAQCGNYPQVSSSVNVFSGATGINLQSHVGNPAASLDIAPTDDIDGDGTDDFLAIARENPAIFSWLTHLSVVSGANGSFLHAPTYNSVFGHRVANAGDVDGDGVSDILILTGFENAICRSGADLSLRWSLPYPQVSTILSNGVLRSLGDLNGDGAHEFLMRRPYASVFSPRTLINSVASAAPIGQGCGLQPSPPTLSATTRPRLHIGSLGLTYSSGTPLASGELFASLPAAPQVFSASCTSYINVSDFLNIAPFVLDSAGTTTFSIDIPRQMSAMGLVLHFQAYAVSFANPANFEITNGLACTFGYY